jgi:hypothetical protein
LRKPILPDRVRQIRGQSFAWLPCRFLHDGFFADLSANQRSLYVFLTLVADRSGLSWWSYERICHAVAIDLDTYIAARNHLIDADLLAFDGRQFQILSLPHRPHQAPALVSRNDLDDHDPATIRRILRDDVGRRRGDP